MKIGTYYYPEQWPHSQWTRDFDRMAAMGMKVVHLGEFAWATMEPAEGQYQLDWLSECVELAKSHRMQVILCTPTAVLPMWMIQKHPDSLLTSKRFGGRRHANHLDPFVQDCSRKITAALAERFGDHPSVMGWQIDNELATNQFDQSPTTHTAFQNWLRDKYGSIDAVNRAWGNQFWNTYYTDFSQILMAKERQSSTYANPHHHVDACRFWSWSLAQYVKLQADVLKPKIGDRWITTNFMPLHLDFDPADARESLSLYSWDAYPVSGLQPNPKDETYRIASPTALHFTHDHMAGQNGRWGLMELQPGQVNWSGVPVLPYPGSTRLWIWSAFAHGAEFVTTYRLRQPLWSVEQWHAGLIQADGVSLSPGGRDFAQVATEMARLDLSRVPALADDIDPSRTVGLVLDFDSLWAITVVPQAKRWSQQEFVQRWYTAIDRLGLRVRILSPTDEIPQGLKLLVVPGAQLVDKDRVAKWDAFASAGGHLLLTTRTALMNRDGHFWEGPTAAPILPLIGAKIEAYDGLPDGAMGHLDLLDGGKHGWNVWGDLLYAEQGTKVLARYSDQFYAGAIAATQAKRGSGVVTYSGVYAEPSFHNALLEKIAKQVGLETDPPSDTVRLVRRGPYTILLNYGDHVVHAPAPKGSKFVVGFSRVEASGVAVWEA